MPIHGITPTGISLAVEAGLPVTAWADTNRPHVITVCLSGNSLEVTLTGDVDALRHMADDIQFALDKAVEDAVERRNG